MLREIGKYYMHKSTKRFQSEQNGPRTLARAYGFWRIRSAPGHIGASLSSSFFFGLFVHHEYMYRYTYKYAITCRYFCESRCETKPSRFLSSIFI